MKDKQIISKYKFERIIKDRSDIICFVKYPKDIEYIEDAFYEIVSGVYHHGLVATKSIDKNGSEIFVNRRVYGFLKG